MFINNDDFILTEETAEKIKRKIEVLRIKQIALTNVCHAFSKYNGKVLNKRVFDGVKDAFNTPGLSVGISDDYRGCIEMSLYGDKITYSEGSTFFYCSSIKTCERLNFEQFKAESWKLVDQYGNRAAEAEKALKTLKSQLKKALKAFETVKTVAYSLPFEIREEFRLLRECF